MKVFNKRGYAFSLLVIGFGLFACVVLFFGSPWLVARNSGAQPEISFYHWRTVYNPGPESLKRLGELETGRLYLRFFEVAVDGEGRPVPQATVIFRQKPHLPVVPVIFLENRVFSHEQENADLAEKLLKRVRDMAGANGLELVPELHLDCDWTASTRAAFFEFAEALRNRLPDGWQLVVTIRLDQFKNYRATGVPPADRGILMAYNMGDIRRPGPGNSIIDPRIAARYIPPEHAYPLPLDLALPIFSWAVVFDAHNRYQGILSPVPVELASPDYCLPVGGGMYVVSASFQTAGGWQVPKGWRLRLEDSPPDGLLAVAEMIRRSAITPGKLVFYHLDERLIKARTREELEEIAACLQGRP